MTSIQELLSSGAEQLKASSQSARLDAELLLAHALKCEKIDLITRLKDEIEASNVELYQSFIERRHKHEPVAYILGYKEFWGIKFTVTPDVLIPRPETEHLVERALEAADSMEGELRILDLGTGSGCIPIALAIELKKRGRDFAITAIDKSESALKIASENSSKYECEIEFIKSDWFSEIPEKEKYDLILSNPPYGSRNDSLMPDLDYEPEAAIFTADEGLSEIKKLLENVPKYLSDRGRFICEIGAGQAATIKDLNSSVTVYKDLAGVDRIIEISTIGA